MTTNYTDNYNKALKLLPVIEDHPTCPNCNALPLSVQFGKLGDGVKLDKWERGYPKYECTKCQTKFFKLEYRGKCKLRGSITRATCDACVYFKPPPYKCPEFVGVLKAPYKLELALSARRKQRKKNQTRRY